MAKTKNVADVIRANLSARGLLVGADRICKLNHATFEEVVGERRFRSVTAARYAFWLWLYEQGLSWGEIALVVQRSVNTVYDARKYRAKRAAAQAARELKMKMVTP